MYSQVIINVDKRLKTVAMKKARREGIPFSSVIKLAIKAFVEGSLNVGIVPGFNTRTAKRIRSAEIDFKKKKNISPGFDNVAQARMYIDD